MGRSRGRVSGTAGLDLFLGHSNQIPHRFAPRLSVILICQILQTIRQHGNLAGTGSSAQTVSLVVGTATNAVLKGSQ